jgi:ribonuclease J
VYVDGLSVGEVGDIVLRDRRALANDGMFMVVVTVDKQTGQHGGRPEIVTRGFVGERDDPIIGGRPSGSSRRSRTRATTSARSACSRRRSRTACRSYLYEQTKRRPMVFPVVVEV